MRLVATKNALYRLEKHWKLTFSIPPLFQTITDISLGILLHFWGIFQFIQAQPLPSPPKQSWMHVSRIFSEFQLCTGCGEGELQNKFWKWCTVLWGSPEITEQDPHSGADWAADCAFLAGNLQWLLRPWIKMGQLALWNKKRLALFSTGTFP